MAVCEKCMPTSKTLMNLRIKKVLLQVQIMNSSIYMNSYISEQLSIVIHFTIISILQAFIAL